MSRNLNSSENELHILYKVGAIASLVLVLIIVIQFIVFIVTPPPIEGSVQDWFLLFQKNSLLGLISFELLMVMYAIISLLVTLALSASLWRINKSLVAIFMTLSVVGVICFVISRPSFEMLSLSNQYYAANTDAQRNSLLAAGQSMLAIFHGTTFYVSYILGSIAGIIISIVILQGKIFSKATAYTRIASSILDFGLFIPAIGLYISLFSVVFLLIFNILVAKRLFKLS